jgi:hypothetical protein
VILDDSNLVFLEEGTIFRSLDKHIFHTSIIP